MMKKTRVKKKYGFKISCCPGSAIRLLDKLFDPAVSAMPLCVADDRVSEVYDSLKHTAELVGGNFFEEFYWDDDGEFAFIYSSWSGKSELSYFDGILIVSYDEYSGIFHTREEYTEILRSISGFGDIKFIEERFPE